MNIYTINQKMKTPAYHFSDFSHSDFTFTAYKNNPNNDYWLVTRTLQASNADNAISLFRKELFKIMDLMFISTQCSFEITGKSFSVFRESNNPGGIFFSYFAQDSIPVGITVGDETKKDLASLNNFNKKNAFSYLHEISHTKTPNTRLAIQIIALEALVERVYTNKACQHCGTPGDRYLSTDKQELINVLGNDIYKKLYGKGGLRNKLIHGHEVVEKEVVELLSPMYYKILSFLVSKFDIQKDIATIKDAPRAFNTFEYSKLFLREKSGLPPVLQEIEDEWEKIQDNESTKYERLIHKEIY